MKKVSRIIAIVLVVSSLLVCACCAAWYDNAVEWAVEKEITAEAVEPEKELTHGKMIGALYAAAKAWDYDVSAWQNVNILSYDDAFFLPEGTAESFQWVCSADLIADDATKLEYDRVLTREDMVDLLYQFAGWMKVDRSVGESTNILSYNDAFDISQGKFAAFQWACGEGIIQGTGNHNLHPQEEATNAQLVTVLMRLGKIVSVVDYSTGISQWMYRVETDDAITKVLIAIDTCPYGTAGAEAQQVEAAVQLLKISGNSAVGEKVFHYLYDMDATQKDYFSFQWQMSVKKAKEILAAPQRYADALNGIENIDATKLDALNNEILQLLTGQGVADVWKDNLQEEPFFLWK